MEKEEIKRRVESRQKEIAQKLKGHREKQEITPAFIKDCIDANELGDGVLFAAMHKGQFVFNKTSGEWLIWAGHHWRRDILDKSLASVENVSRKYIDEAYEIGDQIYHAMKNNLKSEADRLSDYQEKLRKRATRLRSEKGRVNCLKFCHTNPINPLALEGEEFDNKPWLFACENGVLDLKTGWLRDGRPEDYLIKASPVKWKGIDTPAPIWEKTLNEIFQEDGNVVAYLARLFGYCLTGLTDLHVLPVFWGQGRNGKGTIVETIQYVLGDYAAPVESEMLLEGRAKSSSGPSPDIMALKGLRLAWASETPEGRRFSTSKVKWLSGGDKLVGRSPHDRYHTIFEATHKLILLTNFKPHASADDFAFWERVHLIPFNLSYVEREPQVDNERRAIGGLKRRIIEEEASGILAWLVRGCLEWQEIGLQPPGKIREATAEYRRDEDLFADWEEECCDRHPDASGQSAALYSNFSAWWTDNVGSKPPSQKKWAKWMCKRYKREKTNVYTYYGIGLKAIS